LDPLHATTYGTGELIKAALDRGVKEIVLGIGGSATVDGGAGMAQALGYRLLDENGADLPFGGSALLNLKSIDVSQADPRLFETRFRVACDVTSPLLGPTGSAAVFGPQKGASPDDVILLEKALSVLNDVWLKQNMLTPSALPGDGAAGGLGAGLRAFCKAHPESGANLVMDTLELERHLEGADLVITGEGRTDSQTGEGKLCGELAKKAHARGVKVLLLSGALEGRDEDYIPLFDYAFSTSTGRADLSEILAHGPEDLYFTARNIARLLKK
jgi:glycerate kinase